MLVRCTCYACEVFYWFLSFIPHHPLFLCFLLYLLFTFLCPCLHTVSSVFYYLHHRRWRRLYFHPFLSGFLFVCRISQNVADGFGQNLVDRLGVWPWQIDSILVKILIEIRRLEFFTCFFTIERSGSKTIYSTISQKCIGPDMFLWIRHYRMGVCAPPSAFLVFSFFLVWPSVCGF